MQDASGEFTSQDYLTDEHTGMATMCEWRITGTHGERIQLTFTDFQVMSGNDCDSDYLEIRDGYWQKSPLLIKFCGSQPAPRLIVSTGYRLLVNYKVSGKLRHRGFKANYEGRFLN